MADRYDLAKDEKPETPVAEEQKPREKIAVWPMDVRQSRGFPLVQIMSLKQDLKQKTGV